MNLCDWSSDVCSSDLADIRFQQAVRDLYRTEAARDPRFLRIDCGDAEGRMLPPDDIFAKVRAAVDPYLV